MSYCRWSSDDYQCDVYCYADCGGGYTTHVASARYVFKSPLPAPVPFDKGHVTEWMERHNEVSQMLRIAEVKPIGLEYDGKTFNDATAQEAAETLAMLKDAGYNVPQYVIDAFEEEGDEETK